MPLDESRPGEQGSSPSSAGAGQEQPLCRPAPGVVGAAEARGAAAPPAESPGGGQAVAVGVLGDPWGQRNVVLRTSDALQALGSHVCIHLTQEQRWLCCRAALPRAPSWQLLFLLLKPENKEGVPSHLLQLQLIAHQGLQNVVLSSGYFELISANILYCNASFFMCWVHSVLSVTSSSGFGISAFKVYYWDS